ncbi:MAG: TetR family transcriptional regulator [Acidimicrobiales bacterium]
MVTPAPPVSAPSSPVEAGLRARKRAANRDAVRAVALRLFVRRGFDDVSIEEIAENAGVSPSTVYRNFPTKEDLVLANLARRQAEFVDLLDALELDRHGARPTLGDLLATATVTWAPGADDLRLLRSEVALIVSTPALLARMQHLVVEWEAPITASLARRCDRSEDDLALRQLTALFCATIRIVIREWAAGHADEAILDYGRPALDALSALPAARLPCNPAPLARG